MAESIDKTQELLELLKEVCNKPYQQYTAVQPSFKSLKERKNVAFAHLPFEAGIRFEFVENSDTPYLIQASYFRDAQISKKVATHFPRTKELPLGLELAVQTQEQAKETLAKIVEVGKDVVESYLREEGYLIKPDGTATFSSRQ